MIYNTSNTVERQKAITRIKKLLDNKSVIEITEKKPTRTIKQNRYLHLILGFFGSETGYTLEEVKQEIFKKIVNPALFYEGEIGEIVTLQRWRSTADLDTLEMTQAIEKFRDYSSAEAGIYLPSPDEKDFLLQIEIELKNNQII
ncbi:recombination protein NinB [Empedobacter falsenii]|uniref:recombination protein NinB n=1 Tax=Empedobacter falsenii TaxID=343874 RepID=UPI002574A4C5|nr:recombination protein NinB [Empedobacter falsenii]MDM1547407.1 recombination protein NinB [Empedobacter falsenii]